MYPSDYHEDDTSCSYCGVETEVIGPPGPRHKPGCPHAPDPFLTQGERNLTDEEADFLFEQTLGTPLGREMLHMSDKQALAMLHTLLDEAKERTELSVGMLPQAFGFQWATYASAAARALRVAAQDVRHAARHNPDLSEHQRKLDALAAEVDALAIRGSR